MTNTPRIWSASHILLHALLSPFLKANPPPPPSPSDPQLPSRHSPQSKPQMGTIFLYPPPPFPGHQSLKADSNTSTLSPWIQVHGSQQTFTTHWKDQNPIPTLPPLPDHYRVRANSNTSIPLPPAPNPQRTHHFPRRSINQQETRSNTTPATIISPCVKR